MAVRENKQHQNNKVRVHVLLYQKKIEESSNMSGIEGNFDDEEEDLTHSGKPCAGSRRDLVKCLRESECVRVSGVCGISNIHLNMAMHQHISYSSTGLY